MRLTPGIVDSTPAAGGGGITFVGQTTNAITAGTSISVGTPAGVQLDDLLLFICNVSDNSLGFSTSLFSICDLRRDGAGNDRLQSLRYKWAAVGESTTYTFNWSSAAPDPEPNATLICMAFRGVNKASGPLDVAMPAHAVGADSTYHKSNVDIGTNPVICPAVTTVTDGAFVIQASMVNGSGVSAIASSNGAATKAYEYTTQKPYTLVTYEEKATAGAYAAGTHTYTGAASGDDWLAATISLRPN